MMTRVVIKVALPVNQVTRVGTGSDAVASADSGAILRHISLHSDSKECQCHRLAVGLQTGSSLKVVVSSERRVL